MFIDSGTVAFDTMWSHKQRCVQSAAPDSPLPTDGKHRADGTWSSGFQGKIPRISDG